MKSSKGFFGRRTKSKSDEARELLSNLVFSHVPVVNFNFQQKVKACLLAFLNNMSQDIYEE